MSVCVASAKGFVVSVSVVEKIRVRFYPFPPAGGGGEIAQGGEGNKRYLKKRRRGKNLPKFFKEMKNDEYMYIIYVLTHC